MTEQTEERIKIIRQFKSIYYPANASPDKLIKSLKILGYMNFGIVNLLLIFLIVITTCSLFQIVQFTQIWHKFALTVSITLSMSLHAHFSYIELLLKNHIRKLNELNFSFDNTLNIELKDLIHDLNYHRFKPYWITFPTIIVFIASGMMVLEINPFWDNFIWPVLITSILLSWRLNNYIFLVRRNIEMTEFNVIAL